MYRSQTAVVTSPDSALCHEAINSLTRAGVRTHRAPRPADIELLSKAITSFDVLVTLPRSRSQLALLAAVGRATRLKAEFEHLLRCVQPAIRHMSESGHGGRIVSVVPREVDIDALTGALATELADVGICVNSVAVGSGVCAVDVAEVIAYLTGSASGAQVSGAVYTLSGSSMSVRGAVVPGPKRGERYLPKSVQSRLQDLHPGQEH